MAAALAAVSAFAGTASADEPKGLDRVRDSWVSMALGMLSGVRLEAADNPGFSKATGATAAATIRNRGWTASLLVSHFTPRTGDDVAVRLRPFSTVGAQLSVRPWKDTRLTLDVFNVFDREVRGIDLLAVSRLGAQPAIGDAYLFHPAEGRGVRLRIRKTF